jgi:hypothetical protein
VRIGERLADLLGQSVEIHPTSARQLQELLVMQFSDPYRPALQIEVQPTSYRLIAQAVETGDVSQTAANKCDKTVAGDLQ